MFSEALGIFDSLEIREVIITYFPPAAISFSPIMQTQFIFIHFILVSQNYHAKIASSCINKPVKVKNLSMVKTLLKVWKLVFIILN